MIITMKKPKIIVLVVFCSVLAVGVFFVIRNNMQETKFPQCQFGPTDEIVNQPCKNYTNTGS